MAPNHAAHDKADRGSKDSGTWIDFSGTENPFGSPDSFVRAIVEAASNGVLSFNPDRSGAAFRTALSRLLSLPADCIVGARKADGEEYQSYSSSHKSDLTKFYKMMREGTVFRTSLPKLAPSEALFRSILDSGEDLLYIGFSSGLSGTYDAMAGILERLKPSYPDRKIYAIDTLAASLGEGLLVYEACLLREQGQSIEEVYSWLEENRMRAVHWLTVDDLMYLFRGGRVSRTSAWAGELLNIKPIIHVDEEGHLIPVQKVRGRKKSIAALLEAMDKTATQPVADHMVFISHGDCEEEAQGLANKIKEKYGCDVLVNCIDPVIGAHSGPGTVALFFIGENRKA